ncbi:MAG: hypothetical protein HOV79_25695 [Hamadaea sp.]|nr:hypothetical protein [Hamadaea sp.]
MNLVATVLLAAALGVTGVSGITAHNHLDGDGPMPLIAGRPGVIAPTPSPAHSPADPKLVAAIGDWFTKGGDKRVAALQKDFETIATAAGATDVTAVKTGCTTLKTDVDKAQAYAPLPDAAAQKSWAAALDLYEKAALDCVAGAEKQDPTLLLKANDEMIQGSEQLTKATQRIEDILN